LPRLPYLSGRPSLTPHHVNAWSVYASLAGLAGAKVELSTIPTKHSTLFFYKFFRINTQIADNERSEGEKKIREGQTPAAEQRGEEPDEENETPYYI
jgi:hypothetical protein